MTRNHCDFPHYSPLNSYRHGCRCDACRDAKRQSSAKRSVKPNYLCRRCGSPAWNDGGVCMSCYSRPAIERVMERIVIDPNGCWLFTGPTNGKAGYGHVKRQGQRNGGVQAHRVTYEHFIGPIPRCLVVDHLCMVRRCVNPDHLEAVTQSMNMRRASRAKRLGRTPLDERRERLTTMLREALA